MKYRKKPIIVTVDAVQWFKHGDHPAVSKNELSHKCASCGEILAQNHGTLNGVPVCPGDWIVTWPDACPVVYPAIMFEELFEPVGEGE